MFTLKCVIIALIICTVPKEVLLQKVYESENAPCPRQNNAPGVCTEGTNCRYQPASDEGLVHTPYGLVSVCSPREVCCPPEDVIVDYSKIQ